MAMFTKDSPDYKPETPLKPPPMTAAPTSNEAAALSIIAPGTKVQGDIETNSVLKIEGTVEGTIRGARQVLIGRQGEIKGDVHAREVVIGGKVDGTITAAERVEVQGASSVTGDIYTKSIIILEGGRVNGTVRMDDSAAAAAPPVSFASRSEMTKSGPVAVVR
jgi:cytoskeletal protein CcmA (bactofilin family)